MEKLFYKSTGISLVTASFLAVTTMLLHPSGGNIEHIVSISQPLQITHSLAIFCLPFILFGYYGLTHKLSGKWRLSTLSFIIMAFGLFAAMLAALLNGVILPNFLNQYSGNLKEDMVAIKPIVNYGFAINKALDYVFIVSCCCSIAIYSTLILKLNKLSKWIGYFGIAILITAMAGFVTDFIFTSLVGFRIFVFSIATWILSTGISLIRFNTHNND